MDANRVGKFFKYSQLHEVVLIITVFHIILELLIPNMFFIQLCLIAKQSRIIEKKKNLPIYLLRKQPMSYQSPIEPQSRPRCLPESIAIYGPHLILSRNMLTFFSSRSVVLIVKPRRAARTPRTPIVSVLGLLRYPYLKSSISMGILHGPAQLKLLVSMIEVLPPGVQSLSIARQSETLLTIFIILICEYKVVTVQCSQQVALGVSSLPKIYYNIINWMQDHSEEENLINEIQTIVYPSYPLGCSAQDFLTHYEALFDALRRFDRSTDLSGLHRPPHGLKEADKDEKPAKEEEITEHIVMSIINLLNKSCSHCHRKEYSQSIFALLGEFRGHLKDLAIGKQQLRISYWVQHLDIQNPTALYYSIKEPELLAHYDKLYQLLHYIPHRETFLLNYTAVILAQEKFEAALKGAQTSLPIQHQYYLAVIASATYGCKYLWSRAVGAFLRVGGDLAWIVEGSSAAPAIMQEMGRYSALIAYNFKQLAKEDLFGSNSSQGQQRLISLLWLCYYQALACLDLVFGLIPERFDFFKYLPDLPTVHPTIWSFEAVRKTEGMESLHEIRVAEEFASLYSWENDEQEEIIKIEGARSIELPIHTNQMPKRVQSLPDLRNTQIYRLGRAQEEEIFEKISNLQSLRYLKSVFHKYVHFGPLANNYTSNHGSKLEDNMVLASEWDFEIKGLNRIELVLGSKVRQGLQGLVGAMRVENNDKSKQLKHYYQFFNNYMYEYESYTKLMKELSINQKNYLKLVTKSPFLFTQQAFQRMKHDLGKLGLDSLDFVMEAVSFKLELSINLLSFIFDRAAQELQ